MRRADLMAGMRVQLLSTRRRLNARFEVLPGFGGHLLICAIMRMEVSYDEEEAV